MEKEKQNIQLRGNLNFKSQSVTETQKSNLAELELGEYSITCEVTSPSNQTASAKKDVKVTTLAITEVEDNNKKQTAKAIYSEYDLAYFRDLVNQEGEVSNNAKIMNAIDLSKVCNKTVGSWSSIGTNAKKYKGIFEGNSINSIFIDTNESGKGLFGYIENATIKNIVLENGSISAQYEVGGVVGNSKESYVKILKKMKR